MIKLMKPIQLAKSGEVNAKSRKDNGDAGRDLKLVEMNPLHSIEKWKYFFQLQDEIPGWSGSVGATSLSSSLSMEKKLCVLLIAPQQDFLPDGKMPVVGTAEDSEECARNIEKFASSIHDIIITLNSRHLGHISHAIFWTGRDGNIPRIGEKITFDNVKSKIWTPRNAANLKWCEKYTAALEKKGKKLVIQSGHCIIGSTGHAICSAVNNAVQKWAETSLRPVQYINTGKNSRTEMYSALEAEVEDPQDPTTGFNNDLMATLRITEKVLDLLIIVFPFFHVFITNYFCIVGFMRVSIVHLCAVNNSRHH
jgi:nicotinamidase-related amidase